MKNFADYSGFVWKRKVTGRWRHSVFAAAFSDGLKPAAALPKRFVPHRMARHVCRRAEAVLKPVLKGGCAAAECGGGLMEDKTKKRSAAKRFAGGGRERIQA
ncbi:hypothetical protein [Neisseria bacilliformis]|uniref:hypothetical protein n=1 Tax=Neisseria bacilliformis TaxID=267212 RepID=UPI0028EBF8EA|nr:hypothetical protein [Neisseria bacilliformis]